MKKKFLIIVALFSFGFANAQKYEVKVNPLGLFYGKPDLFAEYIVNDNFGVEISLGFAFGKSVGPTFSFNENSSERPDQSGFGAKIVGKYYFSPDQGADGWYGGIYFRQESLNLTYSSAFSANNYKTSIFAGGVEFGKKWVFDTGVLIDISMGTGRAFSEKREFVNRPTDNSFVGFELGYDFTCKFAVGYRFN